MADKNRTLEPKIEPSPEETYPDLLPYEMERAEVGMDILFGLDREQSESNKQEAGEIRRSLGRAKAAKKNRWGHEWAPSPDIRDLGPIRDRHGTLLPSAPPQLQTDRFRDKAVAEHRETTKEIDNNPETD